MWRARTGRATDKSAVDKLVRDRVEQARLLETAEQTLKQRTRDVERLTAEQHRIQGELVAATDRLREADEVNAHAEARLAQDAQRNGALLKELNETQQRVASTETAARSDVARLEESVLPIFCYFFEH